MAANLIKAQNDLIEKEKLASWRNGIGVAHELNNPIGVILNNIQLIKLDLETFDENTVDSINLIENAAKMAKSIVASLLNYSRKADKDNYININLQEIIKDTSSFLKHRTKN